MSNKTDYEVVFQFDFDEEEPKKFSDGRIKRVMAAHEGIFLSDFSDYGIKDLSFTISTTPETLKTIMDTVLKDAERSDVRMSIIAKKQSHLIILNISDVENREQFFTTLEENQESIAYRKLSISSHNPDHISIELTPFINKENALSLTLLALKDVNVKDVSLDTDSIEVMQSDNYKNKKRSSFDY